MQLEKTQTELNCHYRFISAKNIIIPFVSSDDMRAYVDYNQYMCKKKKKKKKKKKEKDFYKFIFSGEKIKY